MPGTGSSKGPLERHAFPVVIPTGMLAIHSQSRVTQNGFFKARLEGHLRGSRFPSPVRDAIPRPQGRAGRAGDAEPTIGGRSLALCQEAPEVLTHWLRLPVAARRIPVCGTGKSPAPGPHSAERAKARVMVTNASLLPPSVPGNNRSHG